MFAEDESGRDWRKFDEFVLPLGPVAIDYVKNVAMPKRSQKIAGMRSPLYICR